MDMTVFGAELEAAINQYDLLKHAYYQAWNAGKLTKDDLKTYAAQYYRHIEAFPLYLANFEARLPEGGMRTIVAINRLDELGAMAPDGCSHSELWLDFARGMGASHKEVFATTPLAEMDQLVQHFQTVSKQGTPIEALTAFYAYESQVPKIAKEKALGLQKFYGADPKTYKYFSVHITADVEHSHSWRKLIEQEAQRHPENRERALSAASDAARCLWQALDGIESERQSRLGPGAQTSSNVTIEAGFE